MRRREFVGLLPATLLAQTPVRPLPQFASLAHQLVWRNWDLVPAQRIAKALSCPLATVGELATEMKLGRQETDARYARRQRFQILRRNWTFAPMEQLTVLANMSEAEITALLAEDAFYNGHLGPKPAARRINVEAAKHLDLDYEIRGAATPIARFDFSRSLQRDMPGRPAHPASPAFDPRIGFPYSAVYGDVLGDPDFQGYYPDAVLESMKQQGLNGIWLHGLLRELTVHAMLPGYGEQAGIRLQRLNGLIERSAAHGLGVYLYLNEPRAMPTSFFDAHPELRGDLGRPGDGLTSLCTSTEPVRRWLREAVQQLMGKAPGLAGLILITASENTTNCYSLRRKTACPRCARRSPASVIGEVVDEIQKGARSAAPKVRILAWDWSWGVVEDDPQSATIASLPKDVTLQVDFERGTPAVRMGRRTLIDEYSLSIPGPSPRAERHIAQAKQRGMSAMAKVQIGNSWELGLLPFIPVPDLIAAKCAALRRSGVQGAMLSWTLGTWPSANWLVAREFFGENVPSVQDALTRAALQRYGQAGVDGAHKAWSIFSRAFAEYPYSNGLVYSSVVQQGPAHPLWLEPSGQRPKILNSFDDLGWTQPYGPEAVSQAFRGMASAWSEGVRAFESVARSCGARAQADQRIHRAGHLYFESIANQVEIHSIRAKPGVQARLRALIEDELRIAEQFLPICEADPRVGFEASLQYFYLPQDVREKILWCRAVLKSSPLLKAGSR
ncbi:hypothetical protein [uncultured Paludibaculum sp.]|uniref:hypothetical protein n=1 Tax=uncultured Paludibaculum sp. TaxID=1765020 RepID=UPI002AAB1687|nr:hypothetical protein [uncultured Paludibaculum sp.]